MEKAYMIRNDGKRFPVLQHPYGNIDEITETLYAGEWLYDHTLHHELQTVFIDLVANYARYIEGLTDPDTLIYDLGGVITGYPYKYLSLGFVDAHKEEIVQAFKECEFSHGKSTVQNLSAVLINDLNQEFLRARFGGLYNTNSSSKEMVFRVSSSGFNWYDIIWTFVEENKRQISTVTIVRDEESTGIQNDFYRSRSGELYQQMPVDAFLSESGNPVIESKCFVRNHLAQGGSLLDLPKLPMNFDRAMYRYHAIQNFENKHRLFGVYGD